MKITDDSFAVLLLTISLSADREEYVRPLTAQEYSSLSDRLRAASLSPSRLLGLDISGLMEALHADEKEAYRLFVLLHRDVQISYMMEALSRSGISAASCLDRAYPQKVLLRAGASAPPFLYTAGDTQSLGGHLIGIYGVNGVKTSDPERKAAEEIADFARDFGYGICVTGETGIGHYASSLAHDRSVPTVCVLSGEMESFAAGHPDMCCVSPVHPQALSTAAHAAERNRVFFSLCDAVFILSTDQRRAEHETAARSFCRSVYVWDGRTGNGAALSRATSFSSLDREALVKMSALWHETDYRQISIFDL